MHIKTFFISTLMLLFLSLPSFGAEVYTPVLSNKAVSGYDSVAYFTLRKAIKGSSNYKYSYKGVDWHFSSAENLQVFKNNPAKYAPQYGGYCAYAIGAKDKLVAANPNNWDIVDNKLYLNYDVPTQQNWRKNISGYIKAANANWRQKLADQ